MRVAACAELDSSTIDSYREQHRVPGGDLPYARAFALWLEDVQQVAQPVHFYKLWGLRAGVLCGIAGLNCLPAAKAVPLAKSKVAPAARVARRQGSTVLKQVFPWPMRAWPLRQGIWTAKHRKHLLSKRSSASALHMPDTQHVLRADSVPECKAECLWCLLRKTIAVRDAGLANSALMEQWLPVLKSHDMAAGTQDFALLLADGICSTLRSRQSCKQAKIATNSGVGPRERHSLSFG